MKKLILLVSVLAVMAGSLQADSYRSKKGKVAQNSTPASLKDPRTGLEVKGSAETISRVKALIGYVEDQAANAPEPECVEGYNDNTALAAQETTKVDEHINIEKEKLTGSLSYLKPNLEDIKAKHLELVQRLGKCPDQASYWDILAAAEQLQRAVKALEKQETEALYVGIRGIIIYHPYYAPVCEPSELMYLDDLITCAKTRIAQQSGEEVQEEQEWEVFYKRK